jgi:heptaprenylglyceryl phosphate synthase
MLIEVAVMTNPEPVSTTTGVDMMAVGGSTNVTDNALYAIIANVVNLKSALIVFIIKSKN